MNFQTGDIIVTRSKKWYWNFVPGWWNHCGMVLEIGGAKYVIEALPFYGVVLIPLDMFLGRQQIYKVLRRHNNHEPKSVIPKPTTQSAAETALSMLGRKYALFGFAGESCVSLVRKAYEYATCKPIYWVRPDDLFTRMNETHFQTIFDSEQ